MSGDHAVLDASRSLASNHVTRPILSRNLSQSSKMAEIKRLERRLRVLEAESDLLRGVFLESLEGRAQLMAEIYEKFENIQQCFMLREQEREETCTNEVQIISPLKDRRAGLLQVLRHEPNSSLVRRDLKAKALVWNHSSALLMCGF